MKRSLALMPLRVPPLAACGGGDSKATTVIKAVTAPASSGTATSVGLSTSSTAAGDGAAPAGVVDPRKLLAKIPGCKLSGAAVQYDLEGSEFTDCFVAVSSRLGLADVDGALLEVDVVPGQAECFALS